MDCLPPLDSRDAGHCTAFLREPVPSSARNPLRRIPYDDFPIPDHRCTLVLLATPVIAAACSSSPSTPSSGVSQSTTTSTTAQVIASSTITIGGKVYDVPSEGGGIPIKPYSDTGQQIIYTSSGFLPRTLYASLHTPVVWTNLSP